MEITIRFLIERLNNLTLPVGYYCIKLYLLFNKAHFW